MTAILTKFASYYIEIIIRGHVFIPASFGSNTITSQVLCWCGNTSDNISATSLINNKYYWKVNAMKWNSKKIGNNLTIYGLKKYQQVIHNSNKLWKFSIFCWSGVVAAFKLLWDKNHQNCFKFKVHGFLLDLYFLVVTWKKGK